MSYAQAMKLVQKMRGSDQHNPYYSMVPDDLYYKYERMGNGINITGAAFEEMEGVRDVNGVLIKPEIARVAHTIGGNYRFALQEAKRRLGVMTFLVKCEFCGVSSKVIGDTFRCPACTGRYPVEVLRDMMRYDR